MGLDELNDLGLRMLYNYLTARDIDCLRPKPQFHKDRVWDFKVRHIRKNAVDGGNGYMLVTLFVMSLPKNTKAATLIMAH